MRKRIVLICCMAILTSCGTKPLEIELNEDINLFNLNDVLLSSINNDIYFYSYGGEISCRDHLLEIEGSNVTVICYVASEIKELTIYVDSGSSYLLEIIYPYNEFGVDPQYTSMKVVEKINAKGKRLCEYAVTIPEVMEPYPRLNHYPEKVDENLFEIERYICAYGRSLGYDLTKYNICYGNYMEHPYPDENGEKQYRVTVSAVFNNSEGWKWIGRFEMDEKRKVKVIDEMVYSFENELTTKRAFALIGLRWKPRYYPLDLGI